MPFRQKCRHSNSSGTLQRPVPQKFSPPRHKQLEDDRRVPNIR
jgi:hypothetical protein